MPSKPAPDWVTKKDLIALLRRNGLRTSVDQLTRWHKAGLIPSPCVGQLGRGRGTESFSLPIARPQAFLVAWTLRINRSFEFARWALWYYGHAGLTEKVREDLVNILKRHERPLTEEIKAFDRKDPRNPIEIVGSAARPPAGWGRTRRRVGKVKGVTVARIFYEGLTGRLVETASQYDPEDLILARRSLAAVNGLDADAVFDAEMFRDALRIFARELNVPRLIRAVKDAPPRVLAV